MTGAVGALGAIGGAAIAQFGSFALSRRERHGDRQVAYLDALQSAAGDLDAAFLAAKNADFDSAEGNALEIKITTFQRARRMISDDTTRDLAEDYYEKLRKYSVEGDDFELERPTTRKDVDDASNDLTDRIKVVVDQIR